MAALALRAAEFKYEVNPSHNSFTARKTGKTFVEAHHLVPVSRQGEFTVGLDVPENVVALCPNCHRLLHHRITGDKRRVLTALMSTRDAALAERGILVSPSTLSSYYGDELTDDD